MQPLKDYSGRKERKEGGRSKQVGGETESRARAL